jgi:hypothetical protein
VAKAFLDEQNLMHCINDSLVLAINVTPNTFMDTES